ncbi:inhibitor of trypsin and hageman factor-like isoform X2 [Bidens hawaiensis]|uniref:inhibitor of trypsin and hageman factor-like isoform X2 n=1 Tax=Bidens hawaiensis TaxID=980011 RepID=UPI00404AAD30
MASISTPIPTSSPSFSLLQKPMSTNYGSPVLRLPLMSKTARVRYSVKCKPAATSTDGEKIIVEGKNSWPELVGEKGEVAKATIEKENPLVYAVILEGDSATSDFGNNRVRVWVNSEGLVIITPVIG